MTFLESMDFMTGLCCALGGVIIGTASGWTLAGWQERRRERLAMQRKPQYITLTCDRRQR